MMSRWSCPADQSLSATRLPLCCSAAAAASRIGPYHQPVVRGDANVYPDNYKADILAFLRTYLNDPAQIRSAAISEPALKPGATGANVFSTTA